MVCHEENRDKAVVHNFTPFLLNQLFHQLQQNMHRKIGLTSTHVFDAAHDFAELILGFVRHALGERARVGDHVHRGHLDVYIDPIQQGARYPVAVAAHLLGRTPALALRITVVPARTRIHRRHQHKLTGKGHRRRRPGNRNLTVLQG